MKSNTKYMDGDLRKHKKAEERMVLINVSKKKKEM